MAHTAAGFVNIPTPIPEADDAADILIVDDNANNLLAIEAVLGDFANRLVRASSGEEALRLLLRRDFALVLLDVEMPGMDGYQTARLIRERRRSRHTPIIFLTAYSRDDQDILRAYQLGAVDFLFKPIVPEVLRAKTAVFVDLQRRTAEVARQAEQLREHERREHERALEEEKRRWEEESLRRQMEKERRVSADMARKAAQLAMTVAEKECAERELKRINQRLADSDRRKDEFLAMLGHELRNPLAPIVTNLELLKTRLQQAGDPDPALERSRVVIERQVGHLRRLVDDLLDVSRITSGKIDLRREAVTAQEVVQQAVVTSRPWVDERGHTLVVSTTEQPLTLFADPVRLTQVLANLLNNAARYTDEGGRIEVRLDADGADAVLTVSDNGRGISAEAMPHIFDVFVQERTGGGGLGLGLTLVRRLVEMHGGQVQVASDGAGQGSTFTVRVPLYRTAELPCPVPEVPAPLEMAEKPLRIVVVEDNDDIRESLTELLETWGHAVQAAADGSSGVDLVLRAQPDVALIDIGLPGLDGYGVAQQIRASGGAIRLVAMTGFGQEDDRRRALEVGFDAHLVKPASIDSLLNILTPAPHATAL